MTSPQVSSNLHPSVGGVSAGLPLYQVLYPFSASLIRDGGSLESPPSGILFIQDPRFMLGHCVQET